MAISRIGLYYKYIESYKKKKGLVKTNPIQYEEEKEL
jgi:hypothetical protein